MDIITTKEVKVSADINELKISCTNCNVRSLCMPSDAKPDLLKRLDELVYIRKRLKSASVLYHSGGRFHALYAVKSGFIKTESLHDDGRVQITGFYMAGEVFGFDGIATDEHMCTAIALEDSEICIIPLDRVRHVGHEFEAIQHHFYKLMSREIVRDHTTMMLLGSMQGEERLAAFMLNLSQRFHIRGYSRFNLILRMKREEIGSYLGMKVETVSRIFTKFQEQGLLNVHQKNIKIISLQGLRDLIDRRHIQ